MKPKTMQMLGAGGAIVLTLAIAVLGVAAFRQAGGLVSASIWTQIMADRLTLGFVRIAIIALATYAIASIPALIIAGRWVRSVGPGGVTMDEINRANQDADAVLSLVRTALEGTPKSTLAKDPSDG